MRFRVEKHDAGLNVHIEDVAGQEQDLIEAIRRCRQSAWACTSGECMNIETIDERVAAGSVYLVLTPRPGTQLDPSGIEECLRYMLPQAVKA